MLKSFYDIGDKVVKDFNGAPVQRLLYSKTIDPVKKSHKKDTTYYEVIMNFDTKKEEIELKLGKELSQENRSLFNGFKTSPRGKRIYFSTNNLYYFLKIIPDTLNYYDQKKKNITVNNDFDQFTDFLEDLKEKFYDKDNILDLNKLKETYKQNIDEDLSVENGKNKKDIENKKRDILEKYVQDNVLGNIKLNDITVFTLTLNGDRISNTKYKNSYNDLVEYNNFYRYIEKEKYKNKTCSCCGDKKDVTAKIEYPSLLKLYVITGNNFFFGKHHSKAARYKHFSLCQDCYIKTYLGAENIINNWNYNFFGDYNLKYFLIPKNIGLNKNFSDRLNYVGEFFESSTNTSEQLENLKGLKEDAFNGNILFDFIFYTPNAQATGIGVEQSFTDITYSRIVKLLESLYDINEEHEAIGRFSKEYLRMSFPYYSIFRVKEGRNYELLKKELLSFYNSILRGGDISYRFILQRFLRMAKWNMKDKSKKDSVIWNVYNMQILLTWISRISHLKGGFQVEDTGEVFQELEFPKIKEYFNIHQETYKNKPRQGLFFLGILINEILRQQGEKQNNFMNKIKYEGLKPRDVQKLISEVTEYLNIYRPIIKGDRVSLFKLNRKVYGLMMDRLQEVEKLKLTKEENLFYILSGIAFAKNVNYKTKEEDLNDE